MTNEQLESIVRYSNLNAATIQRIQQKYFLPDKLSWMKFIRIIFLILGAGFSIAGVVFFFAFNWDAMPKFLKLGVVQGLVVVTAALWFIKKLPEWVRNIALTSSAVLVGVLFAVFGQIYQTEAVAYDLLRNWLLVVTPMAIVGRFSPLTLLWVILLNSTLGTYLNQIMDIDDEPTLLLIVALVNFGILMAPLVLNKLGKPLIMPKWFALVLTAGNLFVLTLGVVIGMVDPMQWTFITHCLLTTILYGYLIRTGIGQRSITSLVMVSISAMVVSSTVIMKFNNEEYGTLFLSIFIIASTTLLSKYFIHLNKTWSHVSN